MLHKHLITIAYGWLTFSGTMHFLVDVASQYLRRVRAPGPETSLYYGLNASFALGQVMLGAVGLAEREPAWLREPPMLAVSLVAALGWLAIAVLFMEYWQPKANGVLVLLLMIAVAVSAPRA